MKQYTVFLQHLIWLTQLGLSVVCPLALFVLLGVLLNNRFVFKLEEGKTRSFGKALFKTYLSYGVTGIVLNPVLNTVWVSVCHISDRIAPLISLVIAIPINFLMNKLWAFKAEES